MSEVKALIITGFGLNCELESRAAWRKAGADADLIHLNDLLGQPDLLQQYKALMFIGGFSYGDHMGSGQVFALRVKHHMKDELQQFIDDGKVILGVCNGFQIMVKMGLLPALDGNYFDQTLALMQNDCGVFQNFWVPMTFESSSPCIFTKGLQDMSLPIRHGEGKIFTPDKERLRRLEDAGCVPCRYVDPETGQPTSAYPHNPNGSLNAIAGLCDPTGRVFGLMPHPEAYLYPENHPQWDQQKLDGQLPAEGLGVLMFRNAVDYLRGSAVAGTTASLA